MSFTVVQWFVLVFSIAAIIKLFFVLSNPKAWFSFAKIMYGKSSSVLMVIEIILAGGLLFYLLKELTIIQVMACLVFGALLTGMTFAAYGKETLEWGSKLLKDRKSIRKSWISMIIWFALAIWALISLFH